MTDAVRPCDDVATPPFEVLPTYLRQLRAQHLGRADPAHARDVGAGEVSVREAVETSLSRIERLDGEFRAFIRVSERALARADALDDLRAHGRPTGALHGVTLAVKDCIDVAGMPTTCGTAIRANRPAAARSAAAVTSLEAAGAVVIGKTNLHEWAFGGTSANPHFGVVCNPRDPTRIPGGSSGGSAVAVASGMAALALGTDTGGSVRIPASYCGVAGLKPTPGRISTTGVEPLSWTLDTVGPLAAHVRDLVVPYRLLAATGQLPPEHPAIGAERPPRLVVEPTFFGNADHLDPEVHRIVAAAVEALGDAGAGISSCALPELHDVREAFFTVVLSEAAAVHSGRRRQDRVQYGEDIRELLSRGDQVRAVEYVNALRARGRFHAALTRALASHDVIVAPVTPDRAAPHGTEILMWPDGSEESLLDACARLCLPASLAGLPALAMPCGESEGLPVGLQVIGPAGGEERVLEAAAWMEDVLEDSGVHPRRG